MEKFRRRVIGFPFRTYHSFPLSLQVCIQRIFSLSHASKLLSRKEIVRTMIEGLRYELDLNELIDMSIYYQAYWESDSKEVVESFVKDGMVAIDVGANIGDLTLLSRMSELNSALFRTFRRKLMSKLGY
jgi:hypothetical protein